MVEYIKDTVSMTELTNGQDMNQEENFTHVIYLEALSDGADTLGPLQKFLAFIHA